MRHHSILSLTLTVFVFLLTALSSGSAMRNHSTGSRRSYYESMAIDEMDPLMQRYLRRLQETGYASSRAPWRSWEFNPPDRIEKQLQRDGHRTWGFVIYRTTYDNDSDWQEFLRRLRVQMDDVFEEGNGQDILDMFTLTVFEDRSLDGADAQEVRRRFLEWRGQAVEAEQGSGVKAASSPRYRFAIQVDADALRAVVYDVPPPEDIGSSDEAGWVKLVDANWPPDIPAQFQAGLGEGLSLPLSLPESDDHEDFPAIEGITDHEVGWMKVPYEYVQSDTYCDAQDKNWWVVVYRRPPTIL